MRTCLKIEARSLLLSYLTLQEDGHSFNLADLLTDIQLLFDLLDATEMKIVTKQ
jgi:hypothetical protein